MVSIAGPKQNDISFEGLAPMHVQELPALDLQRTRGGGEGDNHTLLNLIGGGMLACLLLYACWPQSRQQANSDVNAILYNEEGILEKNNYPHTRAIASTNIMSLPNFTTAPPETAVYPKLEFMGSSKCGIDFSDVKVKREEVNGPRVEVPLLGFIKENGKQIPVVAQKSVQRIASSLKNETWKNPHIVGYGSNFADLTFKQNDLKKGQTLGENNMPLSHEQDPSHGNKATLHRNEPDSNGPTDSISQSNPAEVIKQQKNIEEDRNLNNTDLTSPTKQAAYSQIKTVSASDQLTHNPLVVTASGEAYVQEKPFVSDNVQHPQKKEETHGPIYAILTPGLKCSEASPAIVAEGYTVCERLENLTKYHFEQAPEGTLAYFKWPYGSKHILYKDIQEDKEKINSPCLALPILGYGYKNGQKIPVIAGEHIQEFYDTPEDILDAYFRIVSQDPQLVGNPSEVTKRVLAENEALEDAESLDNLSGINAILATNEPSEHYRGPYLYTQTVKPHIAISREGFREPQRDEAAYLKYNNAMELTFKDIKTNKEDLTSPRVKIPVIGFIHEEDKVIPVISKKLADEYDAINRLVIKKYHEEIAKNPKLANDPREVVKKVDVKSQCKNPSKDEVMLAYKWLMGVSKGSSSS